MEQSAIAGRLIYGFISVPCSVAKLPHFPGLLKEASSRFMERRASMHEVRRAFLLFGLFLLVGSASQMASESTTVPWTRLERHLKRTLWTGGTLPAVRIDLAQSYRALSRLAGRP
jgi:hypothetical protein